MISPKIEPTPVSSSKSPAWLNSNLFLASVLALGIVLIYSNSLRGEFIYDDFEDILANYSIRKLWPISDVFFATKLGHTYLLNRPLVNLTFAINYYTGGLNPLHYHLTNLVIHLTAGLLLFGATRRALSLPALRNRYGNSIPLLSLFIATFWSIHPIQTESVAYITQRYESIMGLFSIASFYCAIRTGEGRRPIFWSMLTGFSCLLALGSKEVAVSIPILILLLDRAIMAGSFKEAWRQRRPMYLALLLAWACFGLLQIKAGGRAGWAGFGLGIPWWRYTLSQPGVILHYLRLVVWPHPLCFDYTWPISRTWWQILPGFITIGPIFIMTIIALFKKPGIGFIGASFFFILAPTSSVMPILDLAVEHRMYLPLAPAVIALVLGGFWIWKEIQNRCFISGATLKPLTLITIATIISSLGILTYLRNEDYRSTLDLWGDSVRKVPNNPRAHVNYGSALQAANRINEAIIHYKKAIELAPKFAMTYNNLGVIYGISEMYPEALENHRRAITLAPQEPNFHSNLGSTLYRKGSLDNAAICFRKTLELDPNHENATYNLGQVYFRKGEFKEAETFYRRALELNPSNKMFHIKLGITLMALKQKESAITELMFAIKLGSDPVDATSFCGLVLYQYKWDGESVTYFKKALDLKPDHIITLVRLGWVLATSPDATVRNGIEAVQIAEKVLSLSKEKIPEYFDLLAASQAESGKFQDASKSIETALKLASDRPKAFKDYLTNRLALYLNNEAYRDNDHSMSSEGTDIRH